MFCNVNQHLFFNLVCDSWQKENHVFDEVWSQGGGSSFIDSLWSFLGDWSQWHQHGSVELSLGATESQNAPWESWDSKTSGLEIPEPCKKLIQTSLFWRVQWFLGLFFFWGGGVVFFFSPWSTVENDVGIVVTTYTYVYWIHIPPPSGTFCRWFSGFLVWWDMMCVSRRWKHGPKKYVKNAQNSRCGARYIVYSGFNYFLLSPRSL